MFVSLLGPEDAVTTLGSAIFFSHKAFSISTIASTDVYRLKDRFISILRLVGVIISIC